MTLTYPQRRSLLAGALSAVWYGHQETFGLNRTRTASPQPPEEDFVASLILHGLPRLVPAWTPLFQQWHWTMNIYGVFCHQKPYVIFAHNGVDTKRELADLLLVHRHLDKSSTMQERAVLLQAKMITSAELTADDDGQLALYTQWGPFKLLGKTGRDFGQDYNLQAVAGQALYAGIAKAQRFPEEILDLPDACPWGTARPAKKTSVEKSLAALLVDLVAQRAGRPCTPPAGTPPDDWARLIHALRQAVFRESLRTRDFKQPGVIRGAAVEFNRMAFVSQTDMTAEKFIAMDNFDGGKTGDQQPVAFDGGEGRAIIIETRERQD